MFLPSSIYHLSIHSFISFVSLLFSFIRHWYWLRVPNEHANANWQLYSAVRPVLPPPLLLLLLFYYSAGTPIKHVQLVFSTTSSSAEKLGQRLYSSSAAPVVFN